MLHSTSAPVSGTRFIQRDRLRRSMDGAKHVQLCDPLSDILQRPATWRHPCVSSYCLIRLVISLTARRMPHRRLWPGSLFFFAQPCAVRRGFPDPSDSAQPQSTSTLTPFLLGNKLSCSCLAVDIHRDAFWQLDITLAITYSILG
jgi:hypothetical protein